MEKVNNMDKPEPDTALLKKDYCVVIPTKNEQDTIGNILAKIKTLTENILVVDSRSEDDTLEEVKKHGVTHVFDNQKGKGDALRVGVQNSQQEIIVFMDADGSHEIADIPKLLQPLLDDEADLVVGSRILGAATNFTEPSTSLSATPAPTFLRY